MAYITLGNLNQLQLEIPTEGTKDWGTRLKDNFVIKLVEHDHSGNGKGAPLGISSFADNVINDIKVRLRNDQFLRARNSSNTGDINLIKADSSGAIQIGDVASGVRIQNNLYVNAATQLNDDLDLDSNDINNVANLNVGSVQSVSVASSNITTDSIDSTDIVLLPVSSDPVSPTDGQIQYSDGTHRPQGLWQYQNSTWVSIQGQVGTNSVFTGAIQDNAVTTAKIANSNVTTAKIADSNVTTAKINDLAVTTNKLDDNSVTNLKLAALAVSTNQLADNAVSSSKLGNQSVINQHINTNFFGCKRVSLFINRTVVDADFNTQGYFVSATTSATLTVPNKAHTFYIINENNANISPTITTGTSSITLSNLAPNTARFIIIRATDPIVALQAQPLTIGT